jgi:hypothetical protein
VFIAGAILNFGMLALVSSGRVKLRVDRFGFPCHLRNAGKNLEACIRCGAFRYGAIVWPIVGTAIFALSPVHPDPQVLIAASVLIILLGAILGSVSRAGRLEGQIITQIMGFFMPLSAILLAFGLVYMYKLNLIILRLLGWKI